MSKDSRFSVDEGAIESLVKEFAINWKSGIQQINDDVLAYFANYRNGMEILKQACVIHIRTFSSSVSNNLFDIGSDATAVILYSFSGHH